LQSPGNLPLLSLLDLREAFDDYLDLDTGIIEHLSKWTSLQELHLGVCGAVEVIIDMLNHLPAAQPTSLRIVFDDETSEYLYGGDLLEYILYGPEGSLDGFSAPANVNTSFDT
jgi:hypothetical protein